MMSEIRVGLIGLGFMGRTHATLWQQVPGARLVAVADADPVRRSGGASVQGNIGGAQAPLDFSGVQTFADGRELIAQAPVDAVDICLPTYLHAEFTQLAAAAGKHVFVEKPMALTSDQAAAMIEAAHRNNVQLMVGQCLRFWPEYNYLRDCVNTGRLGKLLKASFFRLSSKPTWAWEGWLLDPARSGSAMLDMHVHDVDYVNFVLGRPRSIYATAGRTGATPGWDLVTAQWAYPDGCQVNLEGAWYNLESFPFRAGYLAVFERGVVQMDSAAQPTVTLYRPGREAEPVALAGDAYLSELAYFTRCLLEGKSVAEMVAPESARASLELVEAERRSAESGSILSL